MHKLRNVVLAGAAALAVASAAAWAADQRRDLHELTIRLPGGGIERIQYTGDQPPTVLVGASPFTFDPFWSVDEEDFDTPFVGFGESFAALGAMTRDLDRRVDRMLQEARSVANEPLVDADRLLRTSTDGDLPRNNFSYSFVSTTIGGKTCTRVVRISAPHEGKPEVVDQTSGDCGPRKNESFRASDPTSATPGRPSKSTA